MTAFASTPRPPYHVVAFSSQRTQDDDAGYGEMADLMVELASRQPGFLGVESARDKNGFGITNSYWVDEAAIAAWKANIDHQVARRRGRTDWYQHFEMRIGRIERAYGFDKTES